MDKRHFGSGWLKMSDAQAKLLVQWEILASCAHGTLADADTCSQSKPGGSLSLFLTKIGMKAKRVKCSEKC